MLSTNLIFVSLAAGHLSVAVLQLLAWKVHALSVTFWSVTLEHALLLTAAAAGLLANVLSTAGVHLGSSG